MLTTPDTLAERLAALPSANHASADERNAAVAMVLRFDRGEPEVVLMKRREDPRDRWSGQISLPGGHREGEHEELVQTAMRETHEEVGIDLNASGRLLGNMPRVQAKARGKLLPMGIEPFVFERTRSVELLPGVEAQSAFWFPLGRAAAGGLATQYHYEGEGRTLDLPAWSFDEHVVWGLTYEMLSGLIRVATA